MISHELKIITFYSNSHERMYKKYFLNSYKKYLFKHELISKKVIQISETGAYESPGFDKTMLKKINLIIENINIKENKLLVYADCDVQFFSDLSFDLLDKDIMFQQDGSSNNFCAGFFIAKQNKKVINFFREVKNNLINSLDGKIHDQTIINNMFNSGYDKINKGFLCPEKYWTIANSTNNKIWYGGNSFVVPKGIIMHHANFTIGIKNKMKLLKLVKKKILAL